MSALTQALVDAGFNVRRAEAIEVAILGATPTALTTHINDTSDAHDASAISFSPTGTVAATDAQAAIAELDSEKFAASLYVEGTWTPELTFATPGDLSVTYAAGGQRGTYTKIGRLVMAEFNVTTATFTHTTASGECRITGLPFSNGISGSSLRGQVQWAGVTKANYTDLAIRMAAGGSILSFSASGSGQAAATLQAADLPTGGTVSFNGIMPFFT